jgi:hypothetical protein
MDRSGEATYRSFVQDLRATRQQLQDDSDS